MKKPSDFRSLVVKVNRKKKFLAMKVLVIRLRIALKMGSSAVPVFLTLFDQINYFVIQVSGPISAPATPLAAKLANKPGSDLASARKESQLITKNAAVTRLRNAKPAAASATMSQKRGRTGRLASAKWRNPKDRDSGSVIAAMTLCLLLRLRLVHR